MHTLATSKIIAALNSGDAMAYGTGSKFAKRSEEVDTKG